MNFSLIQNVSLNIKSKPLQAQYNSIKKVKQNYMFYFFAQVGKRGEGGKNIFMGSNMQALLQQDYCA